MPPWCGSESAGNNIQSTVEDYLKKNTNLGDIANSILPEQDPKFISAIPKALPSGEKAPLVFEIALPPTSGEVALQYKGNSTPWNGRMIITFSVRVGKPPRGYVTFSLTNADRSTSELQAVFNGDPIRAAANWPDTDGIRNPAFMRGHAVMDARL